MKTQIVFYILYYVVTNQSQSREKAQGRVE